MDKASLVAQLAKKLESVEAQALAFAEEAREDARTGAPRAVNLAAATRNRLEAAQADVRALQGFEPLDVPKGGRIALGAVVELEDGSAGKTVFLAPAGAGAELTGPGGDGFLQVVTPLSPLGAALLGKKVGEVVETNVRGELTEWEIVFAS
jgi:transcription elongation GreA/GreB family factor